jgi:hypothetical protein
MVLIHAEKAFDKLQRPFIIKALKKLGIEGTYHNIIKAIHNKSIANVILNGERQSISSKLRKEPRGYALYSYSGSA